MNFEAALLQRGEPILREVEADIVAVEFVADGFGNRAVATAQINVHTATHPLVA